MEGDCWGVNFQAQYHIQSKDVRKIHMAASKGKVARSQQILFMRKNGFNDMDKKSRTALHLACANSHAEVVTVLLQRKCELNLRDNLERTPLIKAVQCQQEDCARILLDHGADPNVSDIYGNAALHYAACGERVTTVAQLLSHNADIEVNNKSPFPCDPFEAVVPDIDILEPDTIDRSETGRLHTTFACYKAKKL
ncbi:Ankyrin Repeat Domain-Containing Protein 26 [Manis pentadactyla]|nr:Ankyrin Repeat Domain-Containing Protein 26 [Manis pentadactyla]